MKSFRLSGFFLCFIVLFADGFLPVSADSPKSARECRKAFLYLKNEPLEIKGAPAPEPIAGEKIPVSGKLTGIIHFLPGRGRPVDNAIARSFGMGDEGKWKVFVLGEGGVGGKVYRAVEAGGGTVTRTFKIYQHTNVMENDFLLLKTFLKDAENGINPGFKIPRVRIANREKNTIEIQNIEGRDLADLDEFLTLKGNTKENIRLFKRVLDSYHEKLKIFRDYLKKEFKVRKESFNRDGYSSELTTLPIQSYTASVTDKGLQEEPFSVFIRPQNVIIDAATLEVYLVDPY